jgi:hypothetical protein
VRPSSGLTAYLVLLAGLVACADDRKPVDETQAVEPIGFGCLDDMDEVADDPLNPTPAPFCRIGVLGSVELDGRPVPTVAVIDRGSECNRTPKGYSIDLAPGVAARFHAAFQLDPDFVPMDDSPACPATTGSGPVAALPAGARTALEFTTAATVPAPTAMGGTLIIPAAVNARLVEAGSGRVLWRDTCRIDTAEFTAAAGFPGFGNLRQLLSDEALRCARGFAATLGAPAPL